MVESGDPSTVHRWSRSATLMLFALIAFPVAAYFTGTLYGPPDVESVSPSPVVPASLNDLVFLFSAFLTLLALSSIVSFALTALTIRLGARLDTRVNRAVAGYTPIGLVLVMAAVTIALYVLGYFVGILSPGTAHSCANGPFI
jgi:hypothetical protein